MKQLLLTTSLLALGASAHAATLLEYSSAASTTNATLSASTTAAGVTAADMTAGSGLVANSGGTWNWRDWTDGGTANTNAADAISSGHFWSWGFTSTQAYDLTAFDIRLDRSGTGPNEFVLGVVVNGGASTSVLSHDFGDASTGVNFLGIDLSSFDAVTSIEFTLAAFGADSGGATSAGTFDLENVSSQSYGFQLRGDLAAVPLPAGMPLLLAGIGGFAALRRRRG